MATQRVSLSERIFVTDAYAIDRTSSYTHVTRTSHPITVAECVRPVAAVDIPLYAYYKTANAMSFLAEQCRVVDGKLIDMRKQFVHMIQLAETYWDNVLFHLHVVESMKVADAKPVISFRWNVLAREILHVVEQLQKYSHILVQEHSIMQDSLYKGIFVCNPCYENVHMEDGVHKQLMLYKHAACSIREALAKHISLYQTEQWAMLDAVTRRWRAYIRLYEGLQTNERYAKTMRMAQREQWHVADEAFKRIEKYSNDTVAIADQLDRTAFFQRIVQDMIGIQDILKKQYMLQTPEQIAVYAAYIRAANAAIEAITVYPTAFTADTFASMLLQAPGYEAFTDFNVGDYEYEKALMRLQVISNATHSQPLLYDVVANVDIDDTDDRGQLAITDTTAATKVYYHKWYYNAPEVQATLSGGTGKEDEMVIPHIVTTEGNDEGGRYFEVELLNSTGERVTGYISWAAKGW